MRSTVTWLTTAFLLIFVIAATAAANPIVAVAAREALKRGGIWLANQTGSWAYGKVVDKVVGAFHDDAMTKELKAVRSEIRTLQARTSSFSASPSERDRLNREIAEAQLQQLRQVEAALVSQIETLRRLMSGKVDRAEAEQRHREVLRGLQTLEETQDAMLMRIRKLEEQVRRLETRPTTNVSVSSRISNSVTITFSRSPSWHERRHARRLAATGERLLARGAAREAIESYDRALHLNPDLVDAYVGRATARERLKLYTEALSDLGDAISRDDRRHELLLRRAGIYRQLRDFKNAAEDYTIFLTQARRSREKALYGRGAAHAALGNKAAAVADYTACIETAPATPEAAFAKKALRDMAMR